MAPARPAQPLNAGTVGLVAMPSAPFWARRYTRWFLNSCQGVSTGTAETAELLVSELVTNSVRFSGDPAPNASAFQAGERTPDHAVPAAFPRELLIEVFDTDANPPVLADASGDAESGRGLMLVDALSKEWSYFRPGVAARSSTASSRYLMALP